MNKMLLAAAAMLAPISAASALPTLNHAWDLNNSAADALGGPALTLNGTAALTATGANFYAGDNALVLSGANTAFTSGNSYSIELLFRLSDVSGFRRLINTSGTDNGFYVFNSQLDYYEGGAQSGGATFANNQLIHVVFARGGAGTNIYLNGALAVSTASYTSSLITGDMAFFIDEANEETDGFADFIRSYDYQVSGADAAALYNNGNPLSTATLLGAGGVPEPASWALMIGGFGLAGAAGRRRKAAFA